MFYKESGLKFGNVKYEYESARRNRTILKKERYQYALLIATALKKDIPMVWMDSASFNAWSQRKRIWCKSFDPIRLPRQSKRFKGVTLWGCLGRCLDHTVFMTSSSTNQEDYRKFITKIAEAIKPEYKGKEVWLCADNHSAHINRVSIDHAQKYFTLAH